MKFGDKKISYVAETSEKKSYDDPFGELLGDIKPS
jgi:hypothetical protein